MTRPINSFVTAAAIGLATVALPACATNAAQNDRRPTQVAQANNGPNLFALYQQIQRLEQQVRDLTGQVDTLQYKLQQQEQGQRDLYQNLDKRMSALEQGGGGNAGGAGAAGGQASANAPPGGADVPPDVQKAYMAGFDQLRNGQYDAAIASFNQFVAQHPETGLTANAWYWLGEANYVQQNTADAQKAFETVVNRFADSPKVPDSLYKIGLIQAGAGQSDNAQATFQRVIDQYPQSGAAGQAKGQLKAGGS